MVAVWFTGLYGYPHLRQTIAHAGPNSQTEETFPILPKGLIECNILFSSVKIKILGVPFVTQQ